jgi:large subunit ribosomal protein L15
MRLGQLKKVAGSTKKTKRIGRGPGSGHGKTSTRGHKGLKARSGGKVPAWFEGGQMPLQRRIPKRGFTSIFKKEYQIVNLGLLEKCGRVEIINPVVLKSCGLIKKENLPVKILGEGKIDYSATVQAQAFSKSAREKILAAGGKAELIK